VSKESWFTRLSPSNRLSTCQAILCVLHYSRWKSWQEWLPDLHNLTLAEEKNPDDSQYTTVWVRHYLYKRIILLLMQNNYVHTRNIMLCNISTSREQHLIIVPTLRAFWAASLAFRTRSFLASTSFSSRLRSARRLCSISFLAYENNTLTRKHHNTNSNCCLLVNQWHLHCHQHYSQQWMPHCASFITKDGCIPQVNCIKAKKPMSMANYRVCEYHDTNSVTLKPWLHVQPRLK